MRLFALSILCFSLSFLQAQTQNTPAVCQEGDCSPSLLSIELDGPLKASPSAKRTTQFQAAYLRVKEIKKGHAQDPSWTNRYLTNTLGGKSCLRLNQLESRFAYEYQQNPDFKRFIDQNEKDIEAFKEDGFQSSRRVVNLRKRINDKCPREIKKLEKESDVAEADFVPTYMKLGQVQGYFDENGNLLKPIEVPKTAEETTASAPSNENQAQTKKAPKLNKKQQVLALQDKVNQMPSCPDMKGKLDGVQASADKARPKLGLLRTGLKLFGSKLATFAPGPVGLVGQIKATQNVLGGLQKFVPKIKVGGLLGKIGGLFKRGNDLKKKGEDLVNKSKTIKDKADQLVKKADDLQKDLEQRTAAIGNLQNKLDDLCRRKEELQKKLEDKPRKILDELNQQVPDVANQTKGLENELGKANKAKDKVLNQVADLEKEKENLEKEQEALQQAFEQLQKDQDQLAQETAEAEKEVEEVKQQEAKLQQAEDALTDLKPSKELQSELADCASELEGLLLSINGLDGKQKNLNKKLKGLLSKPKGILGKLFNLQNIHKQLKLPKNGIPIIDKTLAKVDGLMDKATAISSTVEALTGKKTKLQEQIENYDKQLDQIKGVYDSKASNLDAMKDELVNLITEKTGLKDKLAKAEGDVAAMEQTVNDFVKRYNIFDGRSACLDKEDLEEKIKDLGKGQEETEPELEELDQDLDKAAEAGEQLEQETEAVEKEIEEEVKQAEELIQAEEEIKEEFGNEVKLEPVTAEEWAESFEVERPYWEAVFHPDDEVVEGYKGRYFEVRLKDANQNVKLLFGPGEYFKSKSEFRKSYGSTIGSFVTEALHAMKKADQGKVKLFIQGSADIAGHKTFSGKLDERFFFDEVKVLPQKSSEDERFESEPVDQSIPERNFRNEHLPNLRGQYLKQMIGAYSKKFDPILLEGAVKSFQDEDERNAIIYLFIPEELVDED